MIRQRCIAASIAGLVDYVETTGIMEMGKETYLAYLPAAHILEVSAAGR